MAGWGAGGCTAAWDLADSVIPCDPGKGQTANPMDFVKMPPAPVAGAKGEQTHVLHVAFPSSVCSVGSRGIRLGGPGMSLGWLRAAVVWINWDCLRWVGGCAGGGKGIPGTPAHQDLMNIWLLGINGMQRK